MGSLGALLGNGGSPRVEVHQNCGNVLLAATTYYLVWRQLSAPTALNLHRDVDRGSLRIVNAVNEVHGAIGVHRPKPSVGVALEAVDAAGGYHPHLHIAEVVAPYADYALTLSEGVLGRISTEAAYSFVFDSMHKSPK